MHLRTVSRPALWIGGAILAAIFILGIVPHFLYAQSPAWNTPSPTEWLTPSPPAVVATATLPPTDVLPTPTPTPTASAPSLVGEPSPVPPTPSPTLTATPIGSGPVRLVIPAIELDAPVTPVDTVEIEVNGKTYTTLDTPNNRAAGWRRTSALLGVPGNTVLNGHNTLHGEVFRYLHKLEAGDLIQMEGADGMLYSYTVAEKLILPEAGQTIEVRLRNAEYIAPTADERLTLVTCHPYGSLRNRLVIIAYPK